MRALLKFLLLIVLLAAVGLGGAWWWAGRMSGPSIDLKQPDRFVGQSSSMELTLQAPDGAFSHASVTLSQNGVRPQPRIVSHVLEAGGRELERVDRISARAVSPGAAYLVTDCLRGGIVRGTAEQ